MPSQVSKYVALCSTKGYAIGRKLQEWLEARLADVEGQMNELAGHVEDVLAICGSRAYVFFLDAAPTERLLTESEHSMLTYLDEEEDLAAAGGGKLRKSILTGARSPPCMAGVRAMALICDAVFWPLISAIKPKAEAHVLDVLPRVWPAVHAFFESAAAAPEGIVDGSLKLELPGAPAPPAPTTASQARRSDRHRADMTRIRAKAAGDATVTRLLAAAFSAMAKGVANHAAEWLPAGLVATDGSTTVAGKLCAANITPELRARYDALLSTSTPVERLHAVGRCVDDRHKRQRVESRAGDQLASFNDQGGWLAREIDTHGLEKAEAMLAAARAAAARARRVTLKQQLIEAGRAKRAKRDAALGGKRARKEKRAAERARIAQVQLVRRYSELKPLAIPALQVYHRLPHPLPPPSPPCLASLCSDPRRSLHRLFAGSAQGVQGGGEDWIHGLPVEPRRILHAAAEHSLCRARHVRKRPRRRRLRLRRRRRDTQGSQAS